MESNIPLTVYTPPTIAVKRVKNLSIEGLMISISTKNGLNVNNMNTPGKPQKTNYINFKQSLTEKSED